MFSQKITMVVLQILDLLSRKPCPSQTSNVSSLPLIIFIYMMKTLV